MCLCFFGGSLGACVPQECLVLAVPCQPPDDEITENEAIAAMRWWMRFASPMPTLSEHSMVELEPKLEPMIESNPLVEPLPAKCKGLPEAIRQQQQQQDEMEASGKVQKQGGKVKKQDGKKQIGKVKKQDGKKQIGKEKKQAWQAD